MVRSPIILCLFATVLLTASCVTSGRWENRNVAVDQWPRDEAACKRKADYEIGKEIDDDPSYRDIGLGDNNTLSANMARHRATKSRDTLMASCMRRLGYMKAKTKGWWF